MRYWLGATTGLALTILAIRAAYIRWWADDFWIAGTVAKYGFLGAQEYWYRNWIGRFAYTFFASAIQMLGPSLPGIVAILTIAGLVFVIARSQPWPVALTIVYAIAFGTSDLVQSALWFTGLLTYVVPLIGIAWWVGHRLLAKNVRVTDFLIPFLAGGFSEVGALCNVVLFGVAFAATRRKSSAVALFASILALAIVAISPGNAVRRSLYPATPPLASLVGETLSATARFFIGTVTSSGLVLVLVFAAAACLSPRVSKGAAVFAVWIAIGAALVTHGAAYATLSQLPPSRSLVVPHAFLVGAMAMLGACIPDDRQWRRPLAGVLVLAGILPLVHAVTIARSIPAASEFAHAWNALDEELRRARGAHVLVTSAPGMVGRLTFVHHERKHNRWMAEYYGLQSLAATPATGPEPAGRVVRIRFPAIENID